MIEHQQTGDINVRAAAAVLGNITTTIDELECEDCGEYTQVEVSYQLICDTEIYVHTFSFYTDDTSEEGITSWKDFLNIITNPDETKGSLAYHIKRNGEIMREFISMCLINQPGPRAAA